MTLFEEVATRLAGRFRPRLEPAVSYRVDERPVTLYAAIRAQFGIEFNESALVATNHDELRNGIRWVYGVLDEVVAARSETWAMAEDRTEEQVIEALMEADRRHPRTPFDGVMAIERAGMHEVLGVGKHRGAVACEAARVGHVTGEGFATALSKSLAHAQTDEQVLRSLEKVIGEVETNEVDWNLPRAWSDLGGTYLRGSPPMGVGGLVGYCRWLSADWSAMTDNRLLARIAELQEEAPAG